MPEDTETFWDPNTKRYEKRKTGVDEKLADNEKFQKHGESVHKTAEEVQASGGLGSMGKDAKRPAPANTPATGKAPVPVKEPLPEQTPTSSPSHVSGAYPKGKDLAAPTGADADTQADAVDGSEYKKKKEGD